MSSLDTKKRPRGAIIDGGEIKVGDKSVCVPASCADATQEENRSPGSGGEVNVQTVTDNEGTVRRIVVQCACGEETVIECTYKGE